jgi:hypothetical protein
VRSTTFLLITLCTSIQLLGVLRIQSLVHGHGRRLADASPAAPYQGPRPQAPIPEGAPSQGRAVPRPRAPRACAPSGLGVAPAIRRACDAIPAGTRLRSGGGEGGRPPIRAPNPSSRRRTHPPHLGQDRTPGPAVLSRPPEPVGAAATSSGFRPTVSPIKPPTSTSPPGAVQAAPLPCPDRAHAGASSPAAGADRRRQGHSPEPPLLLPRPQIEYW